MSHTTSKQRRVNVARLLRRTGLEFGVAHKAARALVRAGILLEEYTEPFGLVLDRATMRDDRHDGEEGEVEWILGPKGPKGRVNAHDVWLAMVDGR